MDHNLPITVASWLVALVPMAALLVMLLFLKWSAQKAGFLALLLALGTGMLVFDMPFDTALVGLGKGVWDALFILLVVWTALLLYQVTLQANGFEAIREGVQKFSENYLFLVLAFGWVFASFLQGVAGFGAPIAIVAPLLIGIGVKPVPAVVIPLIGHIWAKMFGSLGTGWITTLNLVQLESESVTALYTALLLWITDLVAGLMICWIFARWKGVKEGLPAVLILSAIQGGGQVLVTQFNPILSSFIPSIFAMGALFVLSRWDRYKESSGLAEETTILEDEEERGEDDEGTKLTMNQAMMPYYVLTALSVVMLGVPAISEFIGQVEFSFGFPEVSTGYDYVVEAEPEYSPLSIFTHPGFYLLISSLFGYFWFKSKGVYADDAVKEMGKGLVDDAKGSTLSILAFLTMSQVLEHSGQNTVLAMGIAAVAPPVVYAALSSWIGIFGAFMTSSNTSSNILFVPLQANVVETMSELSINQIVAGQSAGAAIGNAMAPANIVIGASTAGIEDKSSEILRPGIIYTLITGVLVSIFMVVMFYFFPA